MDNLGINKVLSFSDEIDSITNSSFEIDKLNNERNIFRNNGIDIN